MGELAQPWNKTTHLVGGLDLLSPCLHLLSLFFINSTLLYEGISLSLPFQLLCCDAEEVNLVLVRPAKGSGTQENLGVLMQRLSDCKQNCEQN